MGKTRPMFGANSDDPERRKYEEAQGRFNARYTVLKRQLERDDLPEDLGENLEDAIVQMNESLVQLAELNSTDLAESNHSVVANRLDSMTDQVNGIIADLAPILARLDN